MRHPPAKVAILGVFTAVFALAMAAGEAWSKPAKKLPDVKDVLTLGKVDGEADTEMSVVTARLSGKPDFKLGGIQDHGSFLQILLPGVIVPEPGKFFEGQGPYVKKLAVFQLTNTDAAVRIFVSKPAAQVKKAARAEILGKRVVLTIDHDKMKELLAATGPEPKPETDKAAENAVATADAKDPIDVAATKTATKTATSNTALAVGAAVPDLRGKLVKVAAFGGFLLFLCGLAWILKPYLRKKAGLTTPELTIKMRTIGTLPLAAKQKLSLIQVGDERILVGVTPENISYIATLDDHGGASLTAASSARPRTPQMTTQMTPGFTRLLAENGAEAENAPAKPAAAPAAAPAETVDLKRQASFAPEKSVETNKADRTPGKRFPAREARSQAKRPVNDTSPARPRVNVAIDDTGIRDVATRKANREGSRVRIDRGSETQKAIDDVTQLIREKLKTLRTI